MPVVWLSIWLIRPLKVLVPSLAAASRPGCDLSCAMSSLSDFAGTSGLTAITIGDLAIIATGAKSFTGS